MSGPLDAYRVEPEALQAVSGNVGGIIVQAVSTVLSLERTVVAPTSFAQIGSTVAAQNTALQGSQVAAVQALLRLLQDVNSLVQRSATDYAAADAATAQGYGGTGAAPTPAATGLWSSAGAGRLAALAQGDSAVRAGDPSGVGTVLDYLQRAGVGEAPTAVPQQVVQHPTGLADWLDQNTAHQQQLGVVNVYAGRVRDLTDVPGGVRGGDLVVVGGPQEAVAVAGSAGQLFNHGPVSPDFSQGATVRVYRPLSA